MNDLSKRLLPIITHHFGAYNLNAKELWEAYCLYGQEYLGKAGGSFATKMYEIILGFSNSGNYVWDRAKIPAWFLDSYFEVKLNGDGAYNLRIEKETLLNNQVSALFKAKSSPFKYNFCSISCLHEAGEKWPVVSLMALKDIYSACGQDFDPEEILSELDRKPLIKIAGHRENICVGQPNSDLNVSWLLSPAKHNAGAYNKIMSNGLFRISGNSLVCHNMPDMKLEIIITHQTFNVRNVDHIFKILDLSEKVKGLLEKARPCIYSVRPAGLLESCHK